jgi:ABC-2 type transport system permease protein
MHILTVFRYQLSAYRNQILGWGFSLLLLAVYLTSLHDTFVAQQNQLRGLIAAYPPELMAAFGGTADLFSPAGYLNFTFFSYIVILVGFMALAAGSGLLSSDEERGRLELTAAYPVSRLGIFAARLAALLVTMSAILVLSWLGFVLTIRGTGLEKITPWEFALPHFELFAFMLLFASLALFLSQVLPSRGAATSLASAVLLTSYVLKVILEIDDNLASLERLLPLHYLKGGFAIEGLQAEWFWGLVVIAFGLIALAAWRFERRDLRVSGEGLWPAGLGFFARRKKF